MDIINDSYKVMYRAFGSWVLYGYADTMNECRELLLKCAGEGWLQRKMYRYDEDSGNWIELYE